MKEIVINNYKFLLLIVKPEYICFALRTRFQTEVNQSHALCRKLNCSFFFKVENEIAIWRVCRTVYNIAFKQFIGDFIANGCITQQEYDIFIMAAKRTTLL